MVAPRLVMDTVQGAQLDIAVYEGKIIRCGVIMNPPIGAFNNSNPAALTSMLSGIGLPNYGDKFPDPQFQDYFCKRKIIRALTAKALSVQCIYEWHGLLTIKDTTTLTNVPTQLHPKDFAPMYVTWVNPLSPASGQVKRIATFNTTLPLRHVIASQTIDHPASVSVLDNFGSVNAFPWYGLPAAFWLYSGLEGISDDNGITYTYTVTFTTKQREDWSQVEFLKDDRGVAVIVPTAQVKALRNKAYAYGQDTSVNGLNKVGMYPLVDFSAIFGFGG